MMVYFAIEMAITRHLAGTRVTQVKVAVMVKMRLRLGLGFRSRLRLRFRLRLGVPCVLCLTTSISLLRCYDDSLTLTKSNRL